MCGRILEKICLQGLGNSGDKSRPRHHQHRGDDRPATGDPSEGAMGTLAHPAIQKCSNSRKLSEKNSFRNCGTLKQRLEARIAYECGHLSSVP